MLCKRFKGLDEVEEEEWLPLTVTGLVAATAMVVVTMGLLAMWLRMGEVTSGGGDDFLVGVDGGSHLVEEISG